MSYFFVSGRQFLWMKAYLKRFEEIFPMDLPITSPISHRINDNSVFYRHPQVFSDEIPKQRKVSA